MFAISMGEALSIAAAANEAGVSKATLYRAIGAGRGPVARKIGSRTVIFRKDLQRWIDALPTLPA